MNKQQLAAKIWESANKMRSKIEANEYKDYILGFIFYKFLSETEVTRLHADGMGDEDLEELREDDTETAQYVRDLCGYFISYDNLFSTWVAKKGDFAIANVRDALSAFDRNIDPARKRVFAASSTPCRPACPNSAPMRKAAARPHVTSSTSSRTFRWTAGRTTTPSASSMNT